MRTIPDFLMDPRVKDAVSAIGSALRRALPEGKFGDREAQALAVSNEAVREFLREELQEIADSLGKDVLVDGEPYRLHEPGADTYHSLCGPLPIIRPSYRKVGLRNGPVVIACYGALETWDLAPGQTIKSMPSSTGRSAL